jgi:hypothetical protein
MACQSVAEGLNPSHTVRWHPDWQSLSDGEVTSMAEPVSADEPANVKRPFHDSMVQSVHYFRELGFFKRYEFASDAELTEELKDRGWQISVVFGVTDVAQNDVSLLTMDDGVIWYKDTEADAVMGHEAYVTLLFELSAISRGAFLPKNIEEIWVSEKGPVEIRFTLAGKTAAIRADGLSDYLDLGILPQINALIQDKGIQFEQYDLRGQDACLVALTPEEKQRLQRERAWKFVIS